MCTPLHNECAYSEFVRILFSRRRTAIRRFDRYVLSPTIVSVVYHYYCCLKCYCDSQLELGNVHFGNKTQSVLKEDSE